MDFNKFLKLGRHASNRGRLVLGASGGRLERRVTASGVGLVVVDHPFQSHDFALRSPLGIRNGVYDRREQAITTARVAPGVKHADHGVADLPLHVRQVLDSRTQQYGVGDQVEIRTDSRRQHSDEGKGPRRQVSVAVAKALPQGAKKLHRDICRDVLCGSNQLFYRFNRGVPFLPVGAHELGDQRFAQ